MSLITPSFRYLSATAFDEDSGRMAALDQLQTNLSELRNVVEELGEIAPAPQAPSVDALSAQLDAFRPRIALVGQVKAGKTALVNALLGMPDFLPSDINPWTSAVTSVHLNAPAPDGNAAVFHFFDEETWARITTHGSRLGELAARSNAEDEAELLSAQVSDLKQRTAARLGRNYHLLLGRSHRFAEATPDLVRRYVCLGDESEETGPREGRFADLTRAADLHLDAPEYSIPLTIEDTPGVNDPFLVREQMTLASLDKSDVCILVLSAYQAMTTVDLGLLRLLRTLKPEQVVIFINRIDELATREADVPKIEQMVRAVLADDCDMEDITIVFGSADWARKAALSSLDNLTETDIATLAPDARSTEEGRRIALAKLREMSGLPDLKAAISERIASGVGARDLAGYRRQALDLIEQAKMHLRQIDGEASGCDEYTVLDRLDAIAAAAEHSLAVAMQTATGAIEGLYGTVVAPWIDRTAPVAAAEGGIVDPSDLRPALVKAYQEISADARNHIDAAMADAEDALREVYGLLLPSGADAFPIHRCHAPEFPRPTALARSTSFDLRGGWRDVLRSASVQAARRAERFHDMAEREFRDVLSEVTQAAIGRGFDVSDQTFYGFLMPHVLNLQALAATDVSPERNRLLGEHSGRLIKRLAGLGARIDAIEGKTPERSENGVMA